MMRVVARNAGLVVAGLLSLPLAAQTPTVATNQPPPKILGAQLRVLDKLVARVSQVDAPLNQEIKVGTLTITVRSCVNSQPEAPPESSAFLEITETRPGEQSKAIFSGWMFASSPALSSLEHPVYDVWVVACKTAPTAAAPAPAAPPAAPAPRSR